MSEFSPRPPSERDLTKSEKGLQVKQALEQLRILLGSYSHTGLQQDLNILCGREDEIGRLARAYKEDTRRGISIEIIDAIAQLYPERVPEDWNGLDALAKNFSCSPSTLREAIKKWLRTRNISDAALTDRESWEAYKDTYGGYIRFVLARRGQQTFFFSPSMADELRLMLNESARSVTPRTSANTSGRSSSSAQRKAESRPTSPLARGGATPSSPSRSSEQALDAGLGITEDNRQERITNLLRRVRVLLQNRSLVSRDHTLLQQAEQSLIREGVTDQDARYYGERVRKIEQDLERHSRED